MCQCQQNNCGCTNKPVNYNLCDCTPEPCTCPVEITTNCITLAEDLSCSGVLAGTNFTEAIQQLDGYVCDAISQLGGTTNLINVGAGAEIYKGIDGLGKREIRTLTSTDNSVTITEGTNTIDFSVAEVTQDNFVRSLIIDITNLPEDYVKSDICDYILALPSADRTIAETDSKWNVIVASIGEGITIREIYEIQDIGKGVITTIVPDNLLLITPNSQGLQDVITVDGILPFANTIKVLQSLDIITGESAPYNGIQLKDNSLASTSIPALILGKGIGNSGTDASFKFYTNRTEFTDGLNSRGIEYAGDYTPTARTLITRKWFEDNLPDIDGSETKVTAGTNVTVTGNGTSATPYIINSTGADGSETKINSGTNVSVTGVGTIASPYVINSTLTVDGSETKLNGGTTTTVTGNGTISTPYTVEVKNNQKILTYPTDFTGTNYSLTNSDFDTLVFINNGSTDVTITVPTGLVDKFYSVFIRQGSGEVAFVGSGTTINTAVGLRISLQNDHVCLDRVGSTSVYHLTGNSKV